MAEADETVDINMVLITLTFVLQYEFAAAPMVSPFHGNWFNTMHEVRRNSLKCWTEVQDSVKQSLMVVIMPPDLPSSLKEPFPSFLSTIMTSAPDIEELHNASVHAAYKELIFFLKQAWGAPFNGCMGLWWYMMSNMFFNLLEQGRPRALIILAHYCIMMKHVAQEGPWWVKKQWGKEAAKIMSTLDAR